MNKDNVSEKKEKSFIELLNENVSENVRNEPYVIRNDSEDFRNKEILSNYDRI
ncbi:hypothetical protein CPT_MarsHill_188 [Staphylococcus phage MarsHill]|nr:hypothetical protein CPT_MarsHill_188 [Staphylococcus phage MarsHill]QQO92837.1 hypothetical protein CPT_Madawaska_187 [Staphylococcus phage Madawaska]